MPSGVFSLKQQVAAIRQGAWTNQPPTAVNYLVVAGGGSGGGHAGGAGSSGGGGAGGLLAGVAGVVAGSSITVTIGAGGSAPASTYPSPSGNNGSNSVFGSITATGGGAGGTDNYGSTKSGSSGGSGGGAGWGGTYAGSAGISGQGNAGGSSTSNNASPYSSCGGGGAGTVGLGVANGGGPGNGGAGIASDISGTRTTYAGGGGGGSNSSSGSGGAGGGGAGGSGANGTSGSANTGGGGGGAGNSGSGLVPGSGGSGIVIVSYPGTTQWFTGGTVYYANGNVVHVFTSSGTLAPTTATPANSSYTISRSLRFNSADSAYLSRTPGSAGNRKTWTWSGWVKRSGLTASNTLFGSGTSGTDYCFLYFQNDDKLVFYNYSSAGVFPIRSTPLYRDVSAWYHVVVAVDTTQATASNRVKLWVNNQQITDFSEATYPNQNNDLVVNSTSAHAVGAFLTGSPSGYFNGYMAEVNFIDGQALTPSSFGETSNFTGVWVPKAYTGTYGTNGFYVNFSDNSNTTAATLGKDYSGNGNNWTPNNFSVTAGAGNDSLVDNPTAYGFDTGVGGTVRGNYATWNSLVVNKPVLTNGNLDADGSDLKTAISTMGVSSGKWYWEISIGSGTNTPNMGVTSYANDKADPGVYLGTGRSYVSGGGGGVYKNYTATSTGANTNFSDGNTAGAVIGFALDCDAGTLAYYVNNVLRQTDSTIATGTLLYPMTCNFNSTTNAYRNTSVNFGQRPFAYTAPSGYQALCTQNLLTPAVVQGDDYFNPVLWTGDGNAPRNITGVGFQPDLVWIKQRSGSNWNILNDAVRGVPKNLYSNTTDIEDTTNYVSSLNADGFTLASTAAAVNLASSTYVAWNWKANGAGSTNTAGSITSTVSANTTSGFSVVTFTSDSGTNTFTVGHGLGVTPAMVIVKSRTNGVAPWYVYHSSLVTNGYLRLNATNAVATDTNQWGSGMTSTLIGLRAGSSTVASTNTVAYCFAPVAGFSAFGSYTGNGSTDGPFVFTGMRPAFIMIKRTDNVGSWIMLDTVRNTFNVMDKTLWANLSDAEGTYTILDAVSNGFKLREASNGYNNNGATYIYATFASNPFKYSLAR